MFGTAVTTLQTSLAQLPMAMTTAGTGFQIFATQAVSGVSGLSAVNAPIAAFKAQIMTLTPAIMSATVGFTMFGARAMVINSTLLLLVVSSVHLMLVSCQWVQQQAQQEHLLVC